jgi:hypothetical protein
MDQKVSKVGLVSKNLLSMFLLLMISACSLLKNDQSVNEKGESLELPKPEMIAMTLFYPKLDGSGLLKAQVQVEDHQKNANQWFVQLLTQLASSRSSDASAVFPEKIEFYSLFLDKNILYLDFSSTIQKSMHPTIQQEQLALSAFLSSIKANFPYAEQVKFLAEHEDTQVIFGHTYAQQPFSLKDL